MIRIKRILTTHGVLLLCKSASGENVWTLNDEPIMLSPDKAKEMLSFEGPYIYNKQKGA